jgi:beta-glucosidase
MKKMLILFLLVSVSFAQDKNSYLDKSLPIEKRVEDLLSKLTLDEKIDLLGGTGFATKKIKRLGIPEMRMTDGPVGVRWQKSTAFPVSIAMAATWNPELVNKIGSAIGRETKGHARHVILGPCVNIARIPMGGRNFESFGEDPFLASKMVVPYIEGVQSEGVAATVKHFAVNNQEFERMFTDVMVSDRALNEIYLPAFKAAVTQADVFCVMSAYNKINLHYASENNFLLIDKLKNEWGFKGLVMSDWGAVHSSIPTALGGLDLEMPDGKYLNKAALQKSIDDGTVPVSKIDDKVRRILTIIFKLGLFDQEEWEENDGLINSVENRKAAYETSLASIVLLKNEQNILPIKTDQIKTIAVIGQNAKIPRTGGGGSAFVDAINPVSPLQGIKSKFPKNVKIEYAPGYDFNEEVEAISNEFLFADENQKQSGLKAEYFDNKNLSGKPKFARVDKNINFKWGNDGPGNGIGDDLFSVRWTGYIKAPKTGDFIISTVSDDGIRFWFEDKLVMEDWTQHAPLTKSFNAHLEKDKLYKIKFEYFENAGGAEAVLGWKISSNLLDEAVKIASETDCVLIFAGTSSQIETEGKDRDDLILPAAQDELISKIADVNKNVIVVLTTGSPVLMDKWINQVGGVLEMWFAGSEGGNAIADVLLGNYNPSGKLPITFPKKWEDCSAYPTYKNMSARTYYADDIYVGYRHFDKYDIEPLFPFGFGLSYTTFEYENLSVTENENDFNISFEIKNTGGVKGEETAQVYVGCKIPGVDRPLRELKGFEKVILEPGETKKILIVLNKKSFARYDEELHEWKVDAGQYEIYAGPSSRNLILKTDVELK